MNAVVLEVRGSRAAVLREDGIVQEIERECQVGETVFIDELAEKKAGSEYSNTRRTARIRKLTAAAAAIIAAVGIAFGYSYENVMAYSYVTVDRGDYSIEYTLNRKNRVIDVRACNEESKELAMTLDKAAKKADIEEAVSLALDSLPESETEEEVFLTAVSGSDEHTEKLAGMIYSEKDGNGQGDMSVNVETSTYDVRREAIDAGMSTGRYQRSMRSAPDEAPGEQDSSGAPDAVQQIPEDAQPAERTQVFDQEQPSDMQQMPDQTRPSVPQQNSDQAQPQSGMQQNSDQAQPQYGMQQDFDQMQSSELQQNYSQVQPSEMQSDFERMQQFDMNQDPAGQPDNY